AFHELTGAFEGLAHILDMTLVTEVLEPGYPFLHLLLRSFGGLAGFPTAVKIDKFAHCDSSFLVLLTLIRLRAAAADIFMPENRVKERRMPGLRPPSRLRASRASPL